MQTNQNIKDSFDAIEENFGKFGDILNTTKGMVGRSDMGANEKNEFLVALGDIQNIMTDPSNIDTNKLIKIKDRFKNAKKPEE